MKLFWSVRMMLKLKFVLCHCILYEMVDFECVNIFKLSFDSFILPMKCSNSSMRRNAFFSDRFNASFCSSHVTIRLSRIATMIKCKSAVFNSPSETAFIGLLFSGLSILLMRRCNCELPFRDICKISLI